MISNEAKNIKLFNIGSLMGKFIGKLFGFRYVPVLTSYGQNKNYLLFAVTP